MLNCDLVISFSCLYTVRWYNDMIVVQTQIRALKQCIFYTSITCTLTIIKHYTVLFQKLVEKKLFRFGFNNKFFYSVKIIFKYATWLKKVFFLSILLFLNNGLVDCWTTSHRKFREFLFRGGAHFSPKIDFETNSLRLMS